MVKVFDLRAAACADEDAWLQVVTADLRLTLPITPYRSFNPCDVVNNRRVMLGVDGELLGALPFPPPPPFSCPFLFFYFLFLPCACVRAAGTTVFLPVQARVFLGRAYRRVISLDACSVSFASLLVSLPPSLATVTPITYFLSSVLLLSRF